MNQPRNRQWTYFPGVHMVEFQLAKWKTKVLTLAKAKKDGLIDPKVQISANEYKMARQQRDEQKSRYEQGELLELVLCVLM